MRILIVSTSDTIGGAARSAYRLHRSLLTQGVDSQMLVQNKGSDDYTVIGPRSKFEKFINLLRATIDLIPVYFYKKRNKILFSPAWLPSIGLIKRINQINPDIVHLHWICGGMLRIEDLKKINAPIIWTLHDMWAFTGGEHIDDYQEHYKDRCGKSRVLGSEKENDLSRKIWKRKYKTYSKIKDMTIITPSHWLSNCSQKSSLLKGKKHLVIPNAINTKLYRNVDKVEARNLWNLPLDKKLILFGAMGATSDPNKGFKELSDALTKLQSKNIEFVVFGSGEPKKSQNFVFKTHYLGQLYDDVSLVSLYNAVDVMVVPSRQENLSNAIMESLSCGTPVVAFNIGGNSDMIMHNKNGYLAKAFDTEDLAYGIDWVINSENYDQLCLASREKVVNDFESRTIAVKHTKFYKKIINDVSSQ